MRRKREDRVPVQPSEYKEGAYWLVKPGFVYEHGVHLYKKNNKWFYKMEDDETGRPLTKDAILYQ